MGSHPRDLPNSMCSSSVAIVASTNWMFVQLHHGLTTRDMLDSMKNGTYVFLRRSAPWTPVCVIGRAGDQEQDVGGAGRVFGGDDQSTAVADHECMRRIEASLGIAGITEMEDLRVQLGGKDTGGKATEEKATEEKATGEATGKSDPSETLEELQA